ncbi:MAG TPA: GNAT family N-acetyltransferase [Cyclobacteriaceae bacterium]|nr:GNAT family N-acetyltransferase [Cyclobacteriaceae bacterium]
MEEIQIRKYSEYDREQLLLVWEKSVLATHHFLKPEDFKEIKLAVQSIEFKDFDVYCLFRNSALLGFLGVAEQKVEMLFLSPEYFGQGLGKKLMKFASQILKANKVDVNEQNEKAVSFYKKLGFETYERTSKDDQGKDYPLLRMKLPIT